MKNKMYAAIAVLCLYSFATAAQKETTMTHHATGTFEVKVAPLEPAFKAEDNSVGRYSLDKQFHGALEATSKGEMLAGGDPKKGYGGYVAIERVVGTLDGRRGTFILQHSSTMFHGDYKMNVFVAPGTGTGELAGIDGTMQIIIKDGKHSYDFAYTLPAEK